MPGRNAPASFLLPQMILRRCKTPGNDKNPIKKRIKYPFLRIIVSMFDCKVENIGCNDCIQNDFRALCRAILTRKRIK